MLLSKQQLLITPMSLWVTGSVNPDRQRPTVRHLLAARRENMAETGIENDTVQELPTVIGGHIFLWEQVPSLAFAWAV